MRKFRYWTAVSLGAVAIATIAGPAISQSATETYTYDALGRLVRIDRSGGQNDGKITGTCFDPAGNRTRYDLSSSAPAACPTPTPVPTPTSTPTPTPTPTNSPPTTVANTVGVLCGATATADLVANDSDPEGNVPLSLVSLSVPDGDGAAGASIISSTSVSITGDFEHSTTIYTYTVQDSLGATSTGTLTINTNGPSSQCGL